MQLTFLGTGAGLPSKERNVTSITLSLLQELNQIWLFDCGEATQHQILRTNIKPGKINKIFITHLHGDHIFGLPGLLSSRSFQGGEDELTIYGPQGLKEYVETSLSVSSSHLTYPISFIEVDEGKILENDQFIVYAKKLAHVIPSFGYKIIEKDKLGELLPDKLQAIGIHPGPIYKKLKENAVLKLDDGRILHRKDFIGPNKKGRIVSIYGDTRYEKEFIDFTKDADVLVHEATFAHDKQELARRYYHTTTQQAAILAKKANVQSLILTHLSSRYQKEDIPYLLKEAKDVFPNTRIAHDFYTYIIK